MPNALITPSIIANEMMLQLQNNLVWANLVNRDYEDEFAKVGDTISIRRPVKFTTRSGATMQVQDVQEASLTLQLGQPQGVDFGFSSRDLTLTIEDFSERYITPAAISLANLVDSSVAALALRAPNATGTAGNRITTFPGYTTGLQRLDELGVPQSDRRYVMTPSDYWGMVGALPPLFVADKAKTAIEKAKLNMLGNVDTYMSQNMPTWTSGARGGTPLTNGTALQTTYAASASTWTQTLATDGWTASVTGVLRAGDVFTIGTLAAGLVDVSPVARANLGRLKQFTVVADANSDGGGASTLTISPPIITSGPQQTCALTAANTDNLAITVLGSANTAYQPSLAFHKNAFALAVRPLDIPMGAHPDARRVTKDGLSIRMIPVYDGVSDVANVRFDIMFGVRAVYPELACRVFG